MQHLSATEPAELVAEDLRADLMAPVRERWEARALRARKSGDHRRARYADRRVAALSRTVAATMARCSTAGCLVACACPGKRPVWYGCRQHWTCGHCRRTRSVKTRTRLRKAIEARWSDARSTERPGFRSQHRLVLMTLTPPAHTGDIAADKATVGELWRALYQRMHAEFGKYPYSAVWEVTPGTDQLGHVHMHVAAVWPWRDWNDVHAMWLDAGGAPAGLHLKASSTPKRAARYLAKYLSKGVDTVDFTPELRARVVAAFYGARTVNTSRHFWTPVSTCLCGVCKAPVQVSRSVGESWLRALPARPAPATGPPLADTDERASAGGAGRVQWWT